MTGAAPSLPQLQKQPAQYTQTYTDPPVWCPLFAMHLKLSSKKRWLPFCLNFFIDLVITWFPPPTLKPDQPHRSRRIDYKVARRRECSQPDLPRLQPSPPLQLTSLNVSVPIKPVLSRTIPRGPYSQRFSPFVHNFYPPHMNMLFKHLFPSHSATQRDWKRYSSSLWSLWISVGMSRVKELTNSFKYSLLPTGDAVVIWYSRSKLPMVFFKSNHIFLKVEV